MKNEIADNSDAEYLSFMCGMFNREYSRVLNSLEDN